MSIRIAVAIRESREARGLTQERLGELVGKSPSYIGQIERGLSFPSIPVLARLVEVLNIDANTLFYDEADDSPASNEIARCASRLSPDKQEFMLTMIDHLKDL